MILAPMSAAIFALETRTESRAISQADCQIAAIAQAQGMAVATRNIRDFLDTGIEVIDPWESA